MRRDETRHEARVACAKISFFPLWPPSRSLSLSRPLDLDQNKKKTQSTPFKIAVLLKTYPWTGLESLACEIKPIHLALQRPPRDLEGSPRTRGVAASLFSHVFFLRGQNGVLREKESLSLSLSLLSFHHRRCPLKSGLTSFFLHELNSKSKTSKKKIISQQKNRTKQREMSL